MAGQLNLYDTTIPMYEISLKALSGVLQKAEEHAQATGMDPKELLEARLIADMYSLPEQVQTACNSAKFVAVRVGGLENVVQEDNAKTFAELRDRIAATLAFLAKAKREDFEGKQDQEVEYRGQKYTGLTYCTRFSVPNFYFHMVTAYGILRSKGVPIGKANYLGLQ